VIENYQPMGEAIHAQIDELERNVMCGSLNERDIQNLHSLRRDVVRLRRYAAPMVEIGEELQKLNFPFIDKNMRPYFRDVQIHVTRQMEDLTTLADIASQTIEIGCCWRHRARAWCSASSLHGRRFWRFQRRWRGFTG
jgi:magnesium transporter